MKKTTSLPILIFLFLFVYYMFVMKYVEDFRIQMAILLVAIAVFSFLIFKKVKNGEIVKSRTSWIISGVFILGALVYGGYMIFNEL
ncbi:hypothetical protein [Nonlabens sp.]|uniref:hypothetical protein n=2 Tax=Nonlabens sp. TaxID=1888209 RepID=UPI00326448F8